MQTGERLRRRLDQAEADRLAAGACLSTAAVRRRPDDMAEVGNRQQFQVDADRVLHSLAYTRYIDKTQVFSLLDNDHITHRVLHVQLVGKIGRTVGRLLGLNEDLIEAIALAHDIGHPPFGHDGESYLDEKCRQHGLAGFQHNLQSVRFLERLEKGGRGLNLTLQVLDGVLTHDGEVHSSDLTPRREKSFADFDAECAAKEADPGLELVPMTLEGCVVRVADTVAYIGRDLEDAILVGLISRADIPREVAEVLGRTNGTMVYRLVEDLVANSEGAGAVRFSPAVSAALGSLKRFNLERIYLDRRIKGEHPKVRSMFFMLFDAFLEDLEKGRQSSQVYRMHLDLMDEEYAETSPPAVVVRDFLAGMTDEYILKCYRDMLFPSRLPSYFLANSGA